MASGQNDATGRFLQLCLMRICVIDILLLPYFVLSIFIFRNFTIMKKIICYFQYDVFQLKLFQKFLRYCFYTLMCAKYISCHRTGRTTISTMIDRANNGFLKIVFLFDRTENCNSQCLFCNPTLTKFVNGI